LEHAIKHCNEVVEEKLYEIQDCLEVHDMESVVECEKCAEDHNQVANWLRQLQAIQRIVKEYYYTPTQVMDCSDAFNMIREVIEEKK
jgi:DNA repair ATPase RecN